MQVIRNMKDEPILPCCGKHLRHAKPLRLPCSATARFSSYYLDPKIPTAYDPTVKDVNDHLKYRGIPKQIGKATRDRRKQLHILQFILIATPEEKAQYSTMPPSTASSSSSAATSSGKGKTVVTIGKPPVVKPCWCGDDCQYVNCGSNTSSKCINCN